MSTETSTRRASKRAKKQISRFSPGTCGQQHPTMNTEAGGESEEEEEDKTGGGKPKRPVSGYLRFDRDVRAKLAQENPDLTVTEVSQMIGVAWHELDAKKRKSYNEEASLALAKFKADHPELPKPRRDMDALKRKTKKDLEAALDDEGWVKVIVARTKENKLDKFWYSPEESKRFRSLAEVRRFWECLEEVDGDENKASELLKEKIAKKKELDGKNNDGNTSA